MLKFSISFFTFYLGCNLIPSMVLHLVTSHLQVLFDTFHFISFHFFHFISLVTHHSHSFTPMVLSDQILCIAHPQPTTIVS